MDSWRHQEPFSETENEILVVKEPVAVLGCILQLCPIFKRPEQCLKGPDGVIL